jgi:hypothetical protein
MRKLFRHLTILPTSVLVAVAILSGALIQVTTSTMAMGQDASHHATQCQYVCPPTLVRSQPINEQDPDEQDPFQAAYLLAHPVYVTIAASLILTMLWLRLRQARPPDICILQSQLRY